MDQIKSAVLNELTNKDALYSLKVQNHIYGCFIVMEDLAQGVLDLSCNLLINPKFVIDLDTQFANIGLRYGFIMDTKLALNNCSAEYRSAWFTCFRDIASKKTVESVDSMEDTLIEVIQKTVPRDLAFFIEALNSGLSQDWIDKVLVLLNSNGVDTVATVPPVTTVTPVAPLVPLASDTEENMQKTAITTASIEKPTKKERGATRRNKASSTTPVVKNYLAKTRRNNKIDNGLVIIK